MTTGLIAFFLLLLVVEFAVFLWYLFTRHPTATRHKEDPQTVVEFPSQKN